MHIRFFPINTFQDIADRYWAVLNECGVYLPEDTPVWLFEHLSDHANARRTKRLKAAQEGKVYYG